MSAELTNFRICGLTNLRGASMGIADLVFVGSYRECSSESAI